jgi:hypothetical protein
MQTNNLFACKATETTLHIFTGRDSEVATLYEDNSVALANVRLRPVELGWLAYAGQNFERLHQIALNAGPQKKHPLTILPEEETV